MTRISSPCVLVCAIDETTGYCFGCGRTQLEISNWLSYEEEERLQIMKTLEARIKNIKYRSRRQTHRQKIAQKSGKPAIGPTMAEPET